MGRSERTEADQKEWRDHCRTELCSVKSKGTKLFLKTSLSVLLMLIGGILF